MKNCSSCKHKMSMYTGLMDNNHSLVGYLFVLSSKGVSGDFYVKCDNGNTEDCQKWWIDNGSKPLDETSEMSCFEPTKGSIMLGNMMDLLDEMSNKFNK